MCGLGKDPGWRWSSLAVGDSAESHSAFLTGDNAFLLYKLASFWSSVMAVVTNTAFTRSACQGPRRVMVGTLQVSYRELPLTRPSHSFLLLEGTLALIPFTSLNSCSAVNSSHQIPHACECRDTASPQNKGPNLLMGPGFVSLVDSPGLAV